ncbi:hypothetical protein RE6C_00843 [Rhodopirellula europaea 6C]|uniref:Uncharacterized protein n=1 Tax=Rhodopirellula europaea 6C TaxID=1263867 RepID=M2B0H4_9BACT|nr:hypothetical protein RE6C_00843 [Rhodopirellula europaea 6C]
MGTKRGVLANDRSIEMQTQPACNHRQVEPGLRDEITRRRRLR